MASNPNNLDFQCDWRFGFNTSSREKPTVGYLLFWSGCGGLTLPLDIEVGNPFGGQGQTVITGQRVKCVGIIDHFQFGGGEEDPIRISAYVSKEVASDIRAKLARPLPNTKVKVVFYILSFDEDKKLWYESALVRDKAKAKGFVDATDGELQISIANEGTRIEENLDIKVFKFEFQITPAESPALLEFATGPSTRLVKKWTS
jgi:hypothetical protein